MVVETNPLTQEVATVVVVATEVAEEVTITLVIRMKGEEVATKAEAVEVVEVADRSLMGQTKISQIHPWMITLLRTLVILEVRDTDKANRLVTGKSSSNNLQASLTRYP